MTIEKLGCCAWVVSDLMVERHLLNSFPLNYDVILSYEY